MTSSVLQPEQPRLALGLVRERVWTLAVWGAMVAWAGGLFVVVHGSYAHYRHGRFDLGNMVQTVWSTLHGHPLEMTDGPTGEQMVRLGTHVDPFLALLAPVWLAWPSPLALGLAQVVVVALGALPVFWLGRRHLASEPAAALLAMAYLAYPWTATSAAASIHPVTFAITLFLFGVWFLDCDRLWPFAVCAVLGMSTGELMGLPIAALGIWYAFSRGRRREGAAIAVLGVTWTLVAVQIVVPAFRSDGSVYFGFYDEVGGSPFGVAKTLFTDPLAVLGALVEGHDLAYLLWLGVPLLFLFVLSPALAAVAVPQLLANGLSDFLSMTDPRYHSVAAVIPFLIAATVLGTARLGPERRGLAAGAVLVCSATLAVFVAPWARAVGAVPFGGLPWASAETVAALDDALALVPDDAPVTASNNAAGHLSARRYVYSVPVLGRAEWVVVDRADPWIVRPGSPILTRHPRVVRGLVARLEGDTAWTKVFDRDGVVVFRKMT